MLARDVFHCPADEVLSLLTAEQMAEWYVVMNWEQYGKEAPDLKTQFDQLFMGS